jgi:integrase
MTDSNYGTRHQPAVRRHRFQDERIRHVCRWRGLYLRVGPTGAKSWIYRYMADGKRHDMGLGPLNALSLAEARAKAAELRRMRVDGSDPLRTREAQQAAVKLEAAKAMSFKQCAESYIQAHATGWKNAKHAAQWGSTLETYAYPVLGGLPVQGIETGLIMQVLEPIWATKAETASRVRGRIEAILDWATTRGYRQGENPARWRGHLNNLLPKRSKVAKVEHHAALPYAEMAEFMAALRKQEGMGTRALEFAILTAARTGEVIGTQWDEIDLTAAVWTIPGDRMKAGREHRIPLSDRAVAILKEMAVAGGNYLFSGGRKGKPLSNMAMLAVLKRMKRADLTAHGFRSTFRDWASEATDTPHEVAEMALAHTIPNKAEAAYRRGDLFEKRRRLMEAWAAWCGSTPISMQVNDAK